MMIKCKYCLTFVSKGYLKLHMRFKHHFSCMKYTCRFNNCGRSYSNYKIFNKHQRSCKHFEKALKSEINQISEANKIQEAVNICNDKMTESNNNNIFLNNNLNVQAIRNKLRSLALEMISSLQSNATVSRIQIDRITRMFHSFLNTSFVNDLKHEISLMESPNSNDIVEKFEILQSVFSDIDNEYKRNKLFQNLGYYIQPIPIFFGTIEVKDKNGLKTESVYGQFIPLKEVLKTFFGIGDIFERTCKYVSTLNKDSSGEISNFVQTNFWKSKITDSTSITFPLFLYEDA